MKKKKKNSVWKNLAQRKLDSREQKIPFSRADRLESINSRTFNVVDGIGRSGVISPFQLQNLGRTNTQGLKNNRKKSATVVISFLNG